jgi:hypothetical protein
MLGMMEDRMWICCDMVSVEKRCLDTGSQIRVVDAEVLFCKDRL